MMICCAYSEIGKSLGVPTQAYISLSDAKQLDAQAGLESSMGATLAVLSGIDQVSGPGMLDFENCISLEKLVVDNEICGLSFRLGRGITPREDFPSLPHFQELIQERHLLISDHTRKYLRQEIHFPGPSINRGRRSTSARSSLNGLLNAAFDIILKKSISIHEVHTPNSRCVHKIFPCKQGNIHNLLLFNGSLR